MARVKDILDDDEWKMHPLSVALLLLALGLGGMISYNALARQHGPDRGLPALHGDSTVQPDANRTVVLKYNPLIEGAQRAMLELGIYKGPVDGVNGLRTQQAVQQYQQLNGLPVTGEVTEELVGNMQLTKKVQAAAEFTGSGGVAPAPVAPKSPIVSPSQAPAADIKKVQIALAGLGYQISRLDGALNEETRAAILKYEMDNGLDMGGTIDKQLLSALHISSNGP